MTQQKRLFVDERKQRSETQKTQNLSLISQIFEEKTGKFY